MKILIIQLKQLGDVLLSTPLAEAIKFHIPNSKVHFLTSERAQQIVSLNPFIDKTHLLKDGIKNEMKMWIEIRKEKFDAVLDIQRTGRSKRITLFSGAKIRAAFDGVKDKFYYTTIINQTTKGYTSFERLDILKAVGISNPRKFMPKLYFSNKDSEYIKNYLKNHNVKRFFVISPTARKPNKMWEAEKFGKVAKAISTKYNLTPIITYGMLKEKEIAKRVKKLSPLSLLIEKPFNIKQFAALLSLAEFFIGNDSFPSHVAISQNTKTIVICGPTAGWFPENKKTLLIYKGLPCQPCGSYENCRFNLACYRSLTPEEVISKIEKFLKQQLNSYS